MNKRFIFLLIISFNFLPFIINSKAYSLGVSEKDIWAYKVLTENEGYLPGKEGKIVTFRINSIDDEDEDTWKIYIDFYEEDETYLFGPTYTKEASIYKNSENSELGWRPSILCPTPVSEYLNNLPIAKGLGAIATVDGTTLTINSGDIKEIISFDSNTGFVVSHKVEREDIGVIFEIKKDTPFEIPESSIPGYITQIFIVLTLISIFSLIIIINKEKISK